MPTSASGIWPHLPRGTPEPVQGRREPASVAEALYPSLAPKPKRPNPYLDSMTQDAWRDHLWSLAGLKRRR